MIYQNSSIIYIYIYIYIFINIYIYIPKCNVMKLIQPIKTHKFVIIVVYNSYNKCVYIYIYIYIYPKNEYYYVSELFLMKYSAIIISIYIIYI